jgi:hypothetical protein
MEEEKMELGHEPVPGYKKAFFIALTIAVIYFSIIMFSSI